MALNWDIAKVENYNEVCFRTNADGERELRGVTHDLIWLTMAVGMGNITPKNIDEWEFRLQVLSMMPGRDAVEMYARLTREVLEKHIGLQTNVFPNETRAKFMSRMAKSMARDAANAVRNRKEVAA
jgi:hypothetical protein